MEIDGNFSLQYMVREHLVEESNAHQRKAGHGMIRKYTSNGFKLTPLRFRLTLFCLIGPDEMIAMRWNSQFGSVFVDGSHFQVQETFSLIFFPNLPCYLD